MRNWYMRDIIALDIDSVLANTESKIHEYLENKFNFIVDWSKVKRFKLEEFPDIPKEVAEKALDDFYEGGLVADILPYNYTEHALNKLHNEGFKIVLITSRPINLKSLTVDWLDRWSLKYDDVCHIESTYKHALIKTLDAKSFVEDRADILDSVVQNCGVLDYGLFLIDHLWNKNYDEENIIKADNIADAVDRIVEYRKWKNFFVSKCQGDVRKFIKEYLDGR